MLGGGRLGADDVAVYIHTGGLPLIFNLADQIRSVFVPAAG